MVMKAYQAEDRVFARRKSPLSMVDSLDLAAKLFAHFGVEPITVRRSLQKGGNASRFHHPFKGRPAYISLGSHAQDWIVCHEVAHYVAWCRSGNSATEGVSIRDGHGVGWAEAYVEAVRLAIGDTYAARLQNAFTRARLRKNTSR